jgi:hypothetical protein
MDVAGSYMTLHDVTSRKTVGPIFRIRTLRKEYESSVAVVINCRGRNISAFRIIQIHSELACAHSAM